MLDFYVENGFKLFPCKINKAPDVPSWTDPQYHISKEKAETLQKTGVMIGAWIPENMIVIDLDNHDGKENGINKFKEIKEKYNINFSIYDETFCVRTKNNGYHIFFICNDKSITQGPKEGGIDVKTNAGYVIAAGSPGYTAINENDAIDIPDNLQEWLLSYNMVKKKTKKEKDKQQREDRISLDLLNNILKKMDVKEFRSNEEWQPFIASCIRAAGDIPEVHEALLLWSLQDEQYKNDADMIKSRIESWGDYGDITIGTFIHLVKKHGISKYMLQKVLNVVATSILIEQEEKELKLPFPDPDYAEIAESTDAEQFFWTCGNSVASRILYEACSDWVIYVAGEDSYYVFDGNKWVLTHDIYNIVFTILFRLIKFIFQTKAETKADNDSFMTLVRMINKYTWKRDTLREFREKYGIKHDNVKWDDIGIKETITVRDGVIDFSGKEITVREGRRDEYRKIFIDYTADEITGNQNCQEYVKFLDGLFPDAETRRTAELAISLFISGNSNYRIFQIWNGGGFNGKSTLVSVLQKVLGSKTTSYDTKLLMPDKGMSSSLTPELAQFQGVNVAFGIEGEENKWLSVALIKRLTGGDVIKANPKYRDPIEFEATWQLVLACNDLPTFNGHDRAFTNRLLIIPFVMYFVKDQEEAKYIESIGIKPEHIVKRKDKTKMIDDIMEEKPGIIKKMINDYMYFRDELNGIIKESKECVNHKQTYITDNNSIETFLEERCIVRADPDLFVSTDEITDAYHEFTGNNKTSSSWIIRQIKRLKTIVKPKTRYIITNEREYVMGDYVDNEKRKQKRGLENIRLRTDIEVQAYLDGKETEKPNIDDLEF